MPPPVKILIADDDDSVRELLCRLLEKNGFKPLEADNGRDALKMALSKKPRIVIVDLDMPGLDGAEVCKQLSADPSFNGRVLMISGHRDPHKQVSGLMAGASDYILKPFEEEVLVAKISAALRDLDRPESSAQAAHRIRKGDFQLCEITRTLYIKEKKVCILTGIQYQMVRSFLLKSPECISRQELYQEIFQDKSHDIKLIDIHLHNLRHRLGRMKSRLKNIYGKGYLLLTS